jgi:beta-N-acetylglucosaminidase
MTAVQRGLWYAKGEGKGLTTYARPWDSKYKAILGGAMFYSEKYVTKNQYNYYSKKFNVFNGADKLGTHEYMTNVMGAEEEGRLVKRAYKFNNNNKIRFYIPVYEQMPLAPCPRPAE